MTQNEAKVGLRNLEKVTLETSRSSKSASGSSKKRPWSVPGVAMELPTGSKAESIAPVQWIRPPRDFWKHLYRGPPPRL